MGQWLLQIEKKILAFLMALSSIALVLVGIIITFFLFKEVYHLFTFALAVDTNTIYYDALESILSFFLFFEFLTLIITSIKNQGHVSLSFLLTLGLTALIRLLLTYHDQVFGLVVIAISIVLLLFGMTLVLKQEKGEQHEN